MSIIDFALTRSRTILLTLALLLVAGAVTYVSIPKEADPDINIPIIYVSMHHDGISPEDAERLLLRPMEQELTGIDGLKEISSLAFQGGGSVSLEFTAGFDSEQALQDVREKVDDVRAELPEDTDEPSVNEVNLSLFPVLTINLSGDLPERALLRLARELQDRIETLPSVLEVQIGGDRDEVVEIVIDPLLLESYGINGQEVIDTFSRSNRLVAAGNLDTGDGRFAVKVPGLFESAQDIWNIPVSINGDAVVRVKDVAEIRRTFRDPDSFARVNGQKALVLEIVKRRGENIVATIEQVKALVEADRPNWPAGVTVDYTRDRSTDIREMLTDLQNNVISAVLLVMIICVAALGVRSALLVGIAIPGSFLTGIIVLAMLGLTINIVVLFALILAVGILVDGAIVVSEYADRRICEGCPPRTAYREAAVRMSWPIIASTVTTLAAFLPLLFWPGIVGEFMKFLPITLIATLSASLLMALVFVPTLGATLASFRRRKASAHTPVQEVTAPGWYKEILGGAIKRPALVLLSSIGVLAGAIWAYGEFGRGVEFFPDVEPDNAIILIHARGNLSIWEQDALMQRVGQRILGIDGIATVYARTGNNNRGNVAEDVIGQFSLTFTDWDKRAPASDILSIVRERTSSIPGIQIEVRREEAGPAEGKAIEIELTSRVFAALPDAVARVRDHLESMDGLTDIEDSRPIPGIEWRIDVDRAQAAKFGVDVTGVGETVRLVTNGLKVADYRPDDSDDEVDILIRYPEAERSLGALDRVRVASDQGLIPIGNFVERIAQPRVGTIDRVSGQRVMTVRADVAPGVLAADKISEIQGWLQTANLDPRVTLRFKGEDEDQREASTFLTKAFGIALFMIAIVLVTQFNSFTSALLILSAIVMSTVGVLLGLLITDQPFGIVMSGVGVIALAGIVVNNNIVLIDTFDRIRRSCEDPVAAVFQTCEQRFRPVMLTTVTTILGLMPMVLSMNINFLSREISIGAPSTQWWTQLSTAVVFGLAFSTVLTLVVTPAGLMLRERALSRLRGPDAAEAPPALRDSDAVRLPQAAE